MLLFEFVFQRRGYNIEPHVEAKGGFMYHKSFNT